MYKEDKEDVFNRASKFTYFFPAILTCKLAK